MAHLLSSLHVLLAALVGPRCWSHFGIIRGTPCSTIATVAPRHSSIGSGGQGCRGYGQTSWPKWTQHPAFVLRLFVECASLGVTPRGGVTEVSFNFGSMETEGPKKRGRRPAPIKAQTLLAESPTSSPISPTNLLPSNGARKERGRAHQVFFYSGGERPLFMWLCKTRSRRTRRPWI